MRGRRNSYPTPPSSGPRRSRSKRARSRSSMQGIVRNLTPILIDAAMQAAPTPVRVAKAAYDLVSGSNTRGSQTRSSTRNGSAQTSKRVRFDVKGTYKGKFKKPKASGVEKMAAFQNSGFVQTQEVNGKISDPDCVYIAHSAVSTGNLFNLMTQALIRKLFRKHGCKITNIEEEIPGLTAVNTSNVYQIVLTGYDRSDDGTGVTGFKPVWKLTSQDNDTCKSLASRLGTYANITSDDNFSQAFSYSLSDVFQFYASGFGKTLTGQNWNLREFKKLQLYVRDGNVTEFWNFSCELDLEDEIVHIMAKSDLKIQNRTLGATGSADAEDVNNNPIEGRLYQFKGVPRPRVRGAETLGYMHAWMGVNLLRAGQLAGATPNTGQTFKEPPFAKVFSNCTGVSKVRVDPGDIKRTTITYTTKKRFLRFLRMMRYSVGSGTTTQQMTSYSLASSQMIALEDTINVNSVAHINIAYEVNRTMGVYFETKGNYAAQGDFIADSYSNEAPA